MGSHQGRDSQHAVAYCFQRRAVVNHSGPEYTIVSVGAQEIRRPRPPSSVTTRLQGSDLQDYLPSRTTAHLIYNVAAGCPSDKLGCKKSNTKSTSPNIHTSMNASLQSQSHRIWDCQAYHPQELQSTILRFVRLLEKSEAEVVVSRCAACAQHSRRRAWAHHRLKNRLRLYS